MSQDESHVSPDSRRASANPEPWDTTLGRTMNKYGIVMSSFLDRYPAIRRRKWFIAWAVAPLIAAGVFVATHATPDAQASDETALSCSSREVANVVRDIVHKHVFSRQGASMFDEAQFGGQLSNVVTESEEPLTCSADFRPRVVISKAFIAATGNQASFDARSTEKEVADKFTARLSYDVKRTDEGRIYVQVTDGMDTFN